MIVIRRLLGLLLLAPVVCLASAGPAAPVDPVEPRDSAILTVSKDVAQPSGDPSGRIPVLVRLQGEAAFKSFVAAGGRASIAQAKSRADQRVATLQAEQTQFEQAAQKLGAQVDSRIQFLANAVALRIDASRLAELRKIPGVIGVAPNRRYERAHTTSMPLARASEVWEGSLVGGSRTGAGVTIAVIDSGVDYTHRHFGGQGNYDANDRTTLGDVDWPPLALPLNPGDQMVIGGFDFVGDFYNFGLTPMPDPDPAGCPFSHGTHVAGTAAGYGVTAAGDTFTGDITLGNALFPDAPLPSVDAFRIGPGAAPRANLVSLSVFGCSGSTGTDILLQAMEAAATQTYLGQSVDVVNMSLGSAYGGAGSDDFLIGAQQALNEIGVVVVASAGNSGDIQLVTGAPASAPGTISVANITDTGVEGSGELAYVDPVSTNMVRAIAVAGGMYPSNAPDPLTADMTLANPVLACGPLTEGSPGQYTGRWVLVDRGTCNFSQKAQFVKQAGAAGMVLATNDGSPPFSMGRTASFDDLLPAVMISLADGNALKASMLAGPVSATFDGSVRWGLPEPPLQASSSTSRGGVVRGSGDRILKPNIAAPGTTITSAGAGTNDLGYTISGTSMAAPHVAGIAALMIEALGRPSDAAGVARIKQRLMSSATRDVRNNAGNLSPAQSPQRVGSGVVDAVAAINTPIIAYASDAPENGSLSFGYPRQLVGTAVQLTKSITVENLGAAPVSLATSYVPRSAWAGATISAVSPAVVNIASGASSEVQVTLQLNTVQPDLNVGGDPLFPIASKTILHEVSGFVQLTPADVAIDPIRVAVYAAPHLTAATAADPLVLLRGPTGSSSVGLSGQGFNLGEDANDHVSLASAYTLLAEDGVETDIFWDANADGDSTEGERLSDYAYADLAFVGASLTELSATDSILDVGIAMHGEWTSPRDLLVQIFVDVNDDGEFDYLWFYGTGASDAFTVSFGSLREAQIGNYSFGRTLNYQHGVSRDTMLFRNNVMSFPIDVRNVGFTGDVFPNYAGGPIRLRVETRQRDSDFTVLIDSVDATYRPGLQLQNGILRNLYSAQSGTSIDLIHDLPVGDPPAILTLHHHHHVAAQRAQVSQFEALRLSAPQQGQVFSSGAPPAAFQWLGVSGASAYTVTIDAADPPPQGIVLPLVISGSPAPDSDPIACAGSVCTLDFSTSLPVGSYTWTVSAEHPDGEVLSVDGAFGFTLQAPLPDAVFADGFEN